MKSTASKLLSLGIVWLLATTGTAAAGDGWRTLTPPRPLPAPEAADTVQVNGAVIHYALYGSGNQNAVLLLHGGLGAAEDFGGQVDALAERYKVVAIDSRGHGRSTDDDQPYGYHLMASDVMGVMDSLGIDKAAVVGWSDGGNIGLDMAIHNPDRLTRVFALGANYRTDRPSPLPPLPTRWSAPMSATRPRSTRGSRRRRTRGRALPARCSRCGANSPHTTDEQLEGIAVPFVICRRCLRGGHRRSAHEAHGGAHSGRAAAPARKMRAIFAHWQQGRGGECRDPWSSLPSNEGTASLR